MQELIIFKLTSYKKFFNMNTTRTFFEQDDTRRREMARITGVYLPLDMDAYIQNEGPEQVPEPLPKPVQEMDNMAELVRKLHLEECRSSSFRRLLMKE